MTLSTVKNTFAAKSSDLLQLLKAAEAFRKAQPRKAVDAASIFITADSVGAMFELFARESAFAAWIPCSAEGSFSLPLFDFFSFVKSAKGKGEIFFCADQLKSSLGSEIDIAAGDGREESTETNEAGACGYGKRLSLLSFTKEEPTIAAPFTGFPLFPFLSVAPFCGKEEHRSSLMGAQSVGDRIFAADGASLRVCSYRLPSFPRVGKFPEHAFLPSWLASCVIASTPKKKRESLLASFKESGQFRALRYWSGDILFAFRWSTWETLPDLAKLYDQSSGMSLSGEIAASALTKAFVSLSPLLDITEGQKLVEFLFDPFTCSLSLSVKVEKLEDGKLIEKSRKSAPVVSFYYKNPPAIPDNGESLEEEREALKRKNRFCLNASFLEKALKSFQPESLLTISWESESAPVLFSRSLSDAALIMPVMKRDWVC
jgi:hypothetical protein